MEKLRYLDLFAGAGGLSEGFTNAGFYPVAHVEMDKAACYTLKTRIAYQFLKSEERLEEYVEYLKGNITRAQLYSKIPKYLLDSVINLPIGAENNLKIHEAISSISQDKTIDLIIGGPPCQAYSVVGRSRSSTKMEGDPRNYLFKEYAGYLEKYKPKVFVFENVLGLKSAGNGKYLNDMLTVFKELEYQVKIYTLEADKFGVKQRRRRVIIIGSSNDSNFTFPDLEAFDVKDSNKVNVLFEDLPILKSGEGTDKYVQYIEIGSEYLFSSGIKNGFEGVTQHIARPHKQKDLEIYKIAVNNWSNGRKRLVYTELPKELITHKNLSSFTDRFKVVAGDSTYSHTVVAHIAKDGHYYIHPDINQNRSISVREAARLQSFPDNYYFEGENDRGFRTAAFKQIGNAVPPLMAKHIAQEILKGLEK